MVYQGLLFRAMVSRYSHQTGLISQLQREDLLGTANPVKWGLGTLACTNYQGLAH